MERYNITVKDNPFDGCPYADMVVSDDGAYMRYDDAQRALDAEREKAKQLDRTLADVYQQRDGLQAQLRQVEEALQERKEFIADCDTALDRIQAPRTNEGQEELVSTWRRIELLGKLLYQYRQELERSAATLAAQDAGKVSTSIIGKQVPPSQWDKNAEVRGDIS